MKRLMLRYLAVASLVVSVSLLGGCAKKTVKTETGMETAPAQATVSAPPADVGEGAGQEESLAATGGNAAQTEGVFLEGRTTAPLLPIYFDFDKSNIRSDQEGRIKKNGEYLLDNPGVRLRIEGNCDERGTNEYNMALGERRAQSAKKYLMSMGVAASRLDTISYGEERPLNFGHDELAWSQNRRDDFVILK